MIVRGAGYILSGARKLVVNPVLRSELLTQLLFRKSIHQITTLSWRNRYPELFSAVRDLLANTREPRLLSFGCSSGEEVLSLQEYFPDALVIGAEINRAMLRACRRLPPHPNRRFIASRADTISDNGPYDAIFCMAVLTRRPHAIEKHGVRNIAAHYPFDLFADQLRFLVAQLKDSGFFVIEHTLYRVEDVADLPVEPVIGPGTSPAHSTRFDPSGQRLDERPVISRIFQKIAR
jgi:hypothetical protein